MVDSLNYSNDHGELSNSQKKVIITLIQKKDRDRRLIKNWKPISLVNVDVKIGSKAIARRLETVLPYIIHHDQNAVVKGSTIFDAFRPIKGKLSREAHALASCENLKSVRLTFFKLNRQIQNGVHWEGPRWTKEILHRIYVTHA